MTVLAWMTCIPPNTSSSRRLDARTVSPSPTSQIPLSVHLLSVLRQKTVRSGPGKMSGMPLASLLPLLSSPLSLVYSSQMRGNAIDAAKAKSEHASR